MLHSDAGPEAAAVLRIVAFGLWAVIIGISPPLGLAAELPRELFNPPGVVGLLPEAFWDVFLRPGPLLAFHLTAFGMALAAAGGVGPYRIVAPIAFVSVLLFDGIQKSYGGFINHAQMGILYTALVLAVSPGAGEALRLRAGGARSLGSTPARTSAEYRFPLLGAALVLSVAYCLIGAHRVVMGGLAVFTGDALPTYFVLRTVQYAHTQFEWSVWVLQQPLVLAMTKVGFAVTTILELLSPLAVLWRRFRLLWLPVMVAFHLMTLFTMNILFWENLVLIAVVFTGFPGWVQGWMRASSSRVQAQPGSFAGPAS